MSRLPKGVIVNQKLVSIEFEGRTVSRCLFVPDHDFKCCCAQDTGLPFMTSKGGGWIAMPSRERRRLSPCKDRKRPVQGRRSPRLTQRPGCNDDDDDGKSLA